MSYKFENIKILVVEDNPAMTDIIKSVLIALGFKDVHTAKDGEMGYRVFQNIKPDLVITDWMMQPIDGLTLSMMIRNNADSPDPYVPIIMLTGYAVPERVKQARDSGINEFLMKPFKADDLYKRIQFIIERPRQYVQNETFFGPDRRRVQKEIDDNEDKRKGQ